MAGLHRGSRAAVAVLAAATAPACDDPSPPPAEDPRVACRPSAMRPGEATYYDADGTGACSFAPADRPPMVAAIAGADYGSADWCGACVEVVGPQGRARVQIVDSCPGCRPGALDLSREAFATVADPDLGRIPIAWRRVPCEVEGPVVYHFKPGSHVGWTAVQVRHHRHLVESLELRREDGFEPVRRARYNFFRDTRGFGEPPYTFRITDTHGQVLVDEVASLAGTVAGDEQFPACRL